MRWLLGSIVLLLGLLTGSVPVAQASGIAVLRDCQAHGALTHKYSQADYREALANMPADLDEYSDCRSVIETAQAAAAHPRSVPHSNNSPGNANAASAGSPSAPALTGASGDSTRANAPTATPGDLAAIDRAKRSGTSLTLSSGAIRPGAESGITGGGLRSLPSTLRVVLVLLAVAAAAATILGVRRRVLARRRRS